MRLDQKKFCLMVLEVPLIRVSYYNASIICKEQNFSIIVCYTVEYQYNEILGLQKLICYSEILLY